MCVCVCVRLRESEMPLPHTLPGLLRLSLGSSWELLCRACQFCAFIEPLIEAPQAAKEVEPCRAW